MGKIKDTIKWTDNVKSLTDLSLYNFFNAIGLGMEKQGITIKDLAKRLKTSQKRVKEVFDGDYSDFMVRDLVIWAKAANMKVTLVPYIQDKDKAPINPLVFSLLWEGGISISKPSNYDETKEIVKGMK